MSFTFNRKDRLKINQKLNRKRAGDRINWHARKAERKSLTEDDFLEEIKEKKEIDAQKEVLKTSNQNKWYSISVALPGSILNNAQSLDLRTYLAGEIARTCGIFCVVEVVVFDETAKMTQKQIDAYYSGEWTGEEYVSEANNECNFHLARILEYMECPQYLRKAYFPFQKPLNFAGVLNPLDGMHHLRANNLAIPYREGIILDRPPKHGFGSFCDIGLNKELQLVEGEILPADTRVSVEIIEPKNTKGPFYKGKLTSSEKIRKKSGIYWGYSVRLAKSLSDVLSKSYDMVIGTSERGTPVNELPIQHKKNCKILVVFGGLGGLEVAVDADEDINESNPSEFFTNYVNCLPDQGSRIIRTEEAIPITLTALKYKLNEFG